MNGDEDVSLSWTNAIRRPSDDGTCRYQNDDNEAYATPTVDLDRYSFLLFCKSLRFTTSF